MTTNAARLTLRDGTAVAVNAYDDFYRRELRDLVTLAFILSGDRA